MIHKRQHIVAIEGPGGAGKTTLLANLVNCIGGFAFHRPMSNPPQGLTPDELSAFMDNDQEACIHFVRQMEDEPLILCSRWWLSKCIYQTHGDMVGEIQRQRDRFGEPDVWVIMSADVPTLRARLLGRAPDERKHADVPVTRLIAARAALYDEAVQHLKAPIISVNWRADRVDVRSPFDRADMPSRPGQDDVATIVARLLSDTIRRLP